MVSVGTIVWLSSELMFFAGLFAMYFTIREVRPDLWAEHTPTLNVPFATANTIVLVISSVWCQLVSIARSTGSRPAPAACSTSAAGVCASGTS